jgi:hypothetical protein
MFPGFWDLVIEIYNDIVFDRWFFMRVFRYIIGILSMVVISNFSRATNGFGHPLDIFMDVVTLNWVIITYTLIVVTIAYSVFEILLWLYHNIKYSDLEFDINYIIYLLLR